MEQSKNEQMVSSIEQHLESEDIESLKAELPKLLKTFLRVDTRMDRILKQSDNQQYEMLKLKENIEASNERISTLLDNAGQGFLYFNQDMIVGAEYSKEAQRIFDKNIQRLEIDKLLYKDLDDANFLKGTLQTILESDDMKQEILLSLLQKEFTINDAFIEVEYKVLSQTDFMMILTDITAKKELSQQIKDEQQVLKMVVETSTTLEQFISVKHDYYIVTSKIQTFKSLDQLSNLRKEIHTYKGLFAQKEMLNIVKELHQFESFIDESLKSGIISDVIINITTEDMNSWLEKDIKILKDILGEDFFDSTDTISIDKQRINNLYSEVKEYLKNKDLETLVGLGKNLVQLEYSNIKVFLKPYEKLVSQLALRLEKDINPLIIDCPDIYISDKYKPFLNTLVHIFRNSVDHGIEPLEKRIELEKPYEGTINCSVVNENDTLIITINDDGAGIDEEKIKALAVKKGIYSQEEVETLSQKDLLLIIFKDAFSTSEQVTDVSGRGVGLASILKELELLNGTMEINNNFGKGIEFIFTIPFKL